MIITLRQQRFLLRAPACLMGLVLVLAVALGPLSLYLCRTMDGGVSVQQHQCCASKSKAVTIKAERGTCCEQVKAASPQVPALVRHIAVQLEQLWTPVPAVQFPQAGLKAPMVVTVPPSERGPPGRSRPAPFFLLNASLLC